MGKPVTSICLEVRPLLGTVNAYLSGWETFSDTSVQPSEDGNGLFIRSTGSKLHVPWPQELEQEMGMCLKESLVGNIRESSADKELMFRMMFPHRKIDLSQLAAAPKKQKKCDPLGSLKCVHNIPTDELPLDAKISCSSCYNEVGSLNLCRILPLPSISWREFSQDWFCACVHGPDPMAKNKEAPKNRSLSTHELEPRQGDLLFAPSLICLNQTHIKLTAIHDEMSKIVCAQCKKELGNSRKSICQLWQYGVTVSPVRDLKGQFQSPSSSQTFVDLVHGVISECPEQAVKMYLISPLDRKAILLWVIEKELLLYVGKTLSLIQRRQAKKLLFQEVPFVPNQPVKDFRAEQVLINCELYRAGLEVLRNGQQWLASMYRCDGPWGISIL